MDLTVFLGELWEDFGLEKSLSSQSQKRSCRILEADAENSADDEGLAVKFLKEAKTLSGLFV